MKPVISKSEKALNITIQKIDFTLALQILELLNVDQISAFVDAGREYKSIGNFSVTNLIESIDHLSESMLLFDGEVSECHMDKELDVLSNRQIMIDFNLAQNATLILVNLKKVNISTTDVKLAINK